MKKIILFLLVVCATLSVQSQVFVGGSVGFWRNNNNDAKITTFTIAPEVGYIFNEEWAIGTELGYRYKKIEDVKLNTLFIAPYVQYSYFESGKVRLFLNGGFGINSYKNGDADRETGFEIGLKPGFAFKVSDNFCLVAKLGFLGYRDDYMIDDDNIPDNGFGFSLSGNDLSVGFQATF